MNCIYTSFTKLFGFKILTGKIKLEEQRLLNIVNLDEQQRTLKDHLLPINTTLYKFSEENITNTRKFNIFCSCCD